MRYGTAYRLLALASYPHIRQDIEKGKHVYKSKIKNLFSRQRKRFAIPIVGPTILLYKVTIRDGNNPI